VGMPVIPVLRRLKESELQASLHYIGRPCLRRRRRRRRRKTKKEKEGSTTLLYSNSRSHFLILKTCFSSICISIFLNGRFILPFLDTLILGFIFRLPN
jgi:hypothetical protein